jgi:AraC-like DNA-binding protein
MVQASFRKPAGPAGDLIAFMGDYSLGEDESDRLKITVLPTVATLFCFHYSGGMRAEIRGAVGRYRGVVAGMHSAVRNGWPCGPFGSVSVLLRPESVARVIGGQAHDLAEGHFDLSTVFPRAEIERLGDRLAAAASSQQRMALVEALIVRIAKVDRDDGRMVRVAQALQRNPTLSIRDIARRSDLSERQFCRRFREALGVPPKQFARLARFGRVCAMGRRGDRWAQAACEAGYVDQAHMVNDFKAFVGAPPDTALRALRTTPGSGVTGLNAMAAASDFSNCFFS